MNARVLPAFQVVKFLLPARSCPSSYERQVAWELNGLHVWRKMTVGLKLKFLPERFAICRLWPDAELPDWAMSGAFRSVTRTPGELSIVCGESLVPDAVTAERGWRCLMVEGPLDFSLTGILLSIADPLARAGVSIFAVSTFNTDYVLVKESSIPEAIRALTGSGHEVM